MTTMMRMMLTKRMIGTSSVVPRSLQPFASADGLCRLIDMTTIHSGRSLTTTTNPPPPPSSSSSSNSNNNNNNRNQKKKWNNKASAKTRSQQRQSSPQRKGGTIVSAPSRSPNLAYILRHQPKPLKGGGSRDKGPKEPNDITRRIPKIDLTTQLKNLTITDIDAEPEDDEWLDPLIALAVERIQQQERNSDGTRKVDLDIETQLKMMDYFVSPPGSTEDMVGERRILSLEGWGNNSNRSHQGKDPSEASSSSTTSTDDNRQRLIDEVDRLVEEERIKYLELPETQVPTPQELAASETGGIAKIPSNQLAHGDWGEMLIRTDRVCKMWRGGRIESYRALVIGGNLRGCGGFGVGKAFEPEDAVAIAARMSRRNLFFVDRYRNRSLTRDLVGRQNSCKVYLRATTNGLRGNPVACEILKLMGITNAVCKAHGNRNHYNVVRATFKALLTHESLDEIALKRGVRLINLQKAKRLQI